MRRIGLISDTHGHLDDRVFRHFEPVDEVWHAGDFGTPDVADALSSFKPLRGVYGNVDGQELRNRFGETERFLCEEVAVFMTHIGGYPGKYRPIVKEAYRKEPFSLFISGHSHILKVMYDEAWKCLHINPGAAGRQGWHTVRTLVRFCIDTREISQLEVIELR